MSIHGQLLYRPILDAHMEEKEILRFHNVTVFEAKKCIEWRKFDKVVIGCRF